MQKYLVLCLLANLCGTFGCSNSEPEPEPYFFIQLADTQFGMFSNNEGFEEETRLYEKAVHIINRLNPAYVVLCGDLINTPGDKSQRDELLRISGLLNETIPLYYVSGNHDVGGDPTPESLRLYRETIEKDWYTFEHEGTLGIILNSTIIHKPDLVPEAYQAQLDWLTNILQNSQDTNRTHTLIFQHHSYFLETPEEEDQYFNIPIERRQVFLNLLKQHKVQAVFAGHYHRNSYGRDGEMEMITSGPVGKPLGDDPSGLRIVKVYKDSIEHQYYGLDNVPAEIMMETSVVK